MAVVDYKLHPDSPCRPGDETASAHDVLSDAEITAAAESDLDNPPLTDTELEHLAAARRVKHVRAALKLSQEAFAARYGIPVATLRQWEMGRRSPDRASLSYLRVIAAMPDEVAGALG